jgi:hypothetical protein
MKSGVAFGRAAFRLDLVLARRTSYKYRPATTFSSRDPHRGAPCMKSLCRCRAGGGAAASLVLTGEYTLGASYIDSSERRTESAREVRNSARADAPMRSASRSDVLGVED